MRAFADLDGGGERRARAGRRAATLAAACAVALGLSVAPAAARVGALVVPVQGMTCALCTRGVEESIKRLDEVAQVSAELAGGLVRIEAKPGRSLDLRAVRQRVLAAGFRLGGEWTVRALGRFAVGPEGRITFRVPGAATYQVLEGDQLRRLFRRHPGLKGEFHLEFRLHDHGGWPQPAIAIAAFEARPAAARGSAR